MPTTRELVEAGRLAEAVAQLTQEVRARPGDASLRVALFELLSLQGDFERALKHLEVVGAQGVEEDLAVQQYRHLLAGEKARAAVFAGQARPQLGEPQPSYTEHYLRGLASGDPADFQLGDNERPVLSGTLNGVEFEDFRDADDRIGPFLELFLADEYHWIPWEMVRSVTIEQPSKLRHYIWTPISVLLQSGPRLGGFTPTLYPGSAQAPSDALKLGRATEWDESRGYAAGLGQRVFFAGDAQPAMLEIRELEFADAGSTEDS